MALVPFSYASPFTDQLKLRERLFTINGRLLRIQQAWKGDGKGGTDIGFGASVYPAAYVLAEYLERHPYLIRGKRVIELGTGTGFLGIAAAVLGAAEVCLTDGDEESLRLTEENVRANLSSNRTAGAELRAAQQTSGAAGDGTLDNETKGDDSGSGRMRNGVGIGDSDVDCGDGGPRREASDHAAKIVVQKLRWGCAGDMQAAGCTGGGDGDRDNGSLGTWDVVLGSDIAAVPYASAYDDLLRTIVSLVNSSSKGSGGKGTMTSTGKSPSRDEGGETTGDTSTGSTGATPPIDDCSAADCCGGGRGRNSLSSSPMSAPTVAEKAGAASGPTTAKRGDRGAPQAGEKRQVIVPWRTNEDMLPRTHFSRI